VRRELAALGLAVGDSQEATWRDHHWVEYNSLGSVTRTGHLVDDPHSNTYHLRHIMIMTRTLDRLRFTYVFENRSA
jgi:hypothetical protein